MTAPNRLERVIRDLDRDPHLPRVKKLLYCACYGVWEDSSDRLNQVTLEDLVQGVWERSPTLEALQFQLNRVVKTLNKPVEYAHVANGVLRVLSQLYRDTYDITRPVARPFHPGTTLLGGHQPGLNAPGPNRPLTPPVNPPHHASPPGAHHPMQTPTVQLGMTPALQPGTAPAAHPIPRPPLEAQDPAAATQIRYGGPTLAEGAAAQTQWFPGSGPGSAAQRSAEAAVEAHVLQTLVHHPESQRLKKLLLCVCKNFWENDQARLLAVDWRALLQETRQLIPTLENLDYVLQAIVKSLSKPVEYLRVANLLLGILTPIYEQHRPDETQFFMGNGLGSGAPAAAGIGASSSNFAPGMTGNGVPGAFPQPLQTQALYGNPLDGEAEPPTGMFGTGLPANALDERYPPKSLPQDAAARAHGAAANPSGTTQAPGGFTGANSVDDGESEAFALRLELMRYANPLMAKIVAFSALYRLFRFSQQDWTELRHQGLAELLMALQQRYPNFTDLEVNLCAIAEQLEVADKAMQTTAAILKVMKPHYDQAEHTPARALGRRDGARSGPAYDATSSPARPLDPPMTEQAATRSSAATVAQSEDSLEADLARLAAALGDDDLPLPFKS